MSQRVTFGVRSSENLELLTSNPPSSRPSRESRSAILHGMRNNQTCADLKSPSRMIDAFNYDRTNSHSA